MEQAVREYGSEYHWHANEPFLLTDRPGNVFSHAHTYRSGRDALKAVAIACKGRWSRVLLPALCCESMVSPFTVNGMIPGFYKLNPDYTADMADVESKLTEDTVLLYQPYFGIPPFSGEALAQLRKAFPKVLFLEDRTHDLLLPRQEQFRSDVTVASLRKWTAIADGGLLWTDKLSLPLARQDDQFARIRKAAMELKSQYLAIGDPSVKDRFRNGLGQASQLLDEEETPYAMSGDSIALLNRLDTERMLQQRQRNACRLQQLLQGVCRSGKLTLITESPERSTLYFPVMVSDQAYFQSRLAARGVYCPVIWPVPKEALGICLVAEHTAAHMLGIPCDHRYTEADMEYIAAEIVRLCDEQ